MKVVLKQSKNITIGTSLQYQQCRLVSRVSSIPTISIRTHSKAKFLVQGRTTNHNDIVVTNPSGNHLVNN